ncbi:16S rRNA (guanine(966)-N(2))-methyltransferase RsmD [Pelagerythrobacter marinus]|jgi:16S rRNA (guanine966-N2)-methyltransferase|uniref:16S rRNA (guanine(966)-N(2))-methyltransferase RsmD n=1 Tax=Pelagerythrobacter marinus TaxID=538382 RepID=UPI002036EDF7|nr:16S rRNA (guanine(966)-N(2))-methyltransferase RsmD [Pelagerythrobacter marinus]USA40998.1 16S rRNA (guanine(966)-N(2))-methyltransferase RsmD [Pelagerythrobacter marinus]WPZ07828.1 16S rRNA (guanine(966)-N(2))-methyltransferase RsmD [Pelagerythrobacter marinus]
MRIIAGEWRGRRLVAPKGGETRPTADRTRETLFSMLASRLGDFAELQVADLFAGSGALGLEALSRGAGHCLFVEQDEAALKAIRANIAELGARGRSTVRPGSVLSLGPAERAPDLLLLDPPYDTGAGSVALDRMLRLGWIGDATWIAVETGAKETVAVKGLAVEAERKVGKAKLTLLRLADPG